MRIAAIDIGTVTTRLLIVEVTGQGTVAGDDPYAAFRDGVRELYRSTDITNLGEGIEEAGEKLSAEAIQRVVDVAVEYLGKIDFYDVDRVIAVATSAARDAANGDRLVNRLREIRIPLQIIDGEEEARLAFLGTTMGIEGYVLVADVGGGSTELIAGTAGKEYDVAMSFDVGARRITNVLLRSDPPTKPQIEAARGATREMILPFFDETGPAYDEVVCVAGTVTSLSAIQQELDPYDPARVHRSTLSRAQIAGMIEKLVSMDLAARERVVGLEPARASIIIGGALIVQEILSLSAKDSLTVSENDLLYGLVVDAYNT